MMFSNIGMMEKYVKTSPKTKLLIEKFSPGPITYILEAIDSNETIACRIPNDEWIINLINKINKPLYVTSANISGEENLIKYEDVKEKIKADVIVKKDAKGNAASTIIDTTNNYQILRQGPITEKEIKEVLKWRKQKKIKNYNKVVNALFGYIDFVHNQLNKKQIEHSKIITYIEKTDYKNEYHLEEFIKSIKELQKNNLSKSSKKVTFEPEQKPSSSDSSDEDDKKNKINKKKKKKKNQTIIYYQSWLQRS